METGILNVDCFTTTPNEVPESLTFLQLPVPRTPPSSHTSTFLDLLLLCFDSAFQVSLRIEKLPIETALSKFFSDVLPHNIDADFADFEADVQYSSCKTSFASASNDNQLPEVMHQKVIENFALPEEQAENLNEEKEVDHQRPSESEIVEIEVPRKNNGSIADYKNAHPYQVIQFETPELDAFLENDSIFEKGEIHILSEVPEIDNNFEMLKPGPEVHYSFGLRESILSVEDIALEYPMEQNANLSEENGSFGDKIHFNQITFPLVEVDEIVLGTMAEFSLEVELLSFLENVQLQQWTQQDNLDINCKDLLDSKKYDESKLLSDYCVSGEFHESEFGSLENFPEMDLISMLEISQVHLNSAFAGILDCDSFLSDGSIFQEYQILDLDSSQVFEVLFDTLKTDESETCGWMFNEDMDFKNFNKLIVSHELALVDDIFKSLPVPFLDHEKLRSLYAIIEEKLADLKPQPLSSLDEIYLDWHLFEEDKYSCKTYFDYENLLEDMDSPSADFDWDSFDDGKLVYDLVFSDDDIHELNVDEKGESDKLFFDGAVCTDTTMVADSSKFRDKVPQAEDGEQLAKHDADRASLLRKSMSQFNDLDFFLNPQKATDKKNSDSVVDAPSNDATSTKIPPSNSFPSVSQGGKPPSDLAMNENINKQKKLFDLLPMQVKSNMRSMKTANEVEANNMPPFPSKLFAKESEHIQRSMMSFPERLIIVNTQNLDKEMIVSRRSTYQRILAMEKEGAQVVERDSDLPVDVIISSAICLVWYHCRNIGKKATAADEASSCLPLCIDNIATNVLTLLSFTFSGCILIFEGEDGFLSTVMEFSDGLYAAAASLGIDIQLFCSYSSELTDEIILNCIAHATKLTRGVYPRMPESETLAESFLTKFPSINPLTAHAILSSEGMLIEFLEWSHECRIHAIRKYHVPDESITLFTALCKYGEREDSRSIMTDCSSVSSGADSGRFNLNVISERKRRKYNYGPEKCDIGIKGLLCFDPSDQFTKDTLNPSSQKPHDSWMSKDPEILDGFRKTRLPSQNFLFGEEWDFETAMMMNPSIIPKPYDTRMSKGPQMLNEIRNPSTSLNHSLLGKKEESVMATVNNFDLLNASNSEILHEDQKGEVIDLTDSPVFAEDFSIDNSVKFSMMSEMEKDSNRKFKSARRLSFGKSCHPAFQAEVYSDSDIWNSKRAQKTTSLVEASNYAYTDVENDPSPLKDRKKLLEGYKKRSVEKSQQSQFQEETSPYGRTPLSNALRFASPEQNTPWTIEFLNRIREKSRLRQQSLPLDNSAPCLGYLGNLSKDTKRSPSILDFFRYKGGNTPRKIPEQKKQKQSVQSSSSSKHEISSASILPTWTPADKRARKTLSFAVNNGGNQTKLVWSDETHHIGKKLQRQM